MVAGQILVRIVSAKDSIKKLVKRNGGIYSWYIRVVGIAILNSSSVTFYGAKTYHFPPPDVPIPKYHFIRQCIREKKIVVMNIPTVLSPNA